MCDNKDVTDINVGSIKEDIEKCKELIKDKHKEWIGLTNQKSIENILNDLKKYKHAMAMISEICVDESKLHITSAEAIEEIRKNIYHGQ